MSECLVLRLAGPMMSFGGVKVDENNVIDRFPGAAMLVGLLGNALGWEHRDAGRLDRLQQRLLFGARIDRSGARFVDFHTVDLGQDFLQTTWTTRDRPVGRAGSQDTKRGTHIRYRHYWADAVTTVALRLVPPGEIPSLDDLEAALREPERPLFLGRKTCLPAEQICLGRIEAASIRDALAAVSPHPRAGQGPFPARWPQEDERVPNGPPAQPLAVVDQRDWENQIHVGRRLVWEGLIPLAEVARG